MIKKIINDFIGIFGYAIRKPYNYFSLNNNFEWLKSILY